MSDITVVKKFTEDPANIHLLLKIEGKEETYALNKKPDVKSQLVIASKKEILQTLSLETVILNLKNSADLIYIAHNALGGTLIQSKTVGLQHDLLQASADSISAVQDFVTRSADVINYTIEAYNWLFDLEEELAVEQLVTCGEIAGEMAETAKKLAKSFRDLSENSEKILEDSTDLMNLQHQEKLKFENDKLDLIASRNSLNKLQEELEAAYKEVVEEYEEAREREKIESDRAFALGITSAIVQGVGAGLGGIGSGAILAAKVAIASSSPVGMVGVAAATAAASSQSSNQATAKSRTEKLEEAETKKQKLEREKEKIESKINTSKENIKAFEGEKKEKEEEKLKKHQEALKETQEKLDETNQLIQSIMNSVSQVSQQFGQAADRAQSAAEQASSQKMAFFKAKQQLAAENRKALATMEEYAIRISNTDLSKSNADVAVQTLFIAVTALDRIVIALEETAMFWSSMAKFCTRLATSKLLSDLKTIQKLSSPEKRQTSYHRESFLQEAVKNLCGWAALNAVCNEYLEAVKETYEKVKQNKPLKPEDAKKQAPILAEQILKNIRAEKDANAFIEKHLLL
jgi:chemotaxis protein histidine kinase CheA